MQADGRALLSVQRGEARREEAGEGGMPGHWETQLRVSIRGAVGTQQEVPSMASKEGAVSGGSALGSPPGTPCQCLSLVKSQQGCSSVFNRSEIRITREVPPWHNHTSDPAFCKDGLQLMPFLMARQVPGIMPVQGWKGPSSLIHLRRG